MLPKFGDTRVVELVLGDETPKSATALHHALINAVRFHFDIMEVPNLHDFRRFCTTWMPVRMMVSKDLDLLDTPILECCRGTPLFSEDALRRLGRYMNSDAVDDPLELVAGAVGNLRPTEIRRTYCRSWPVLLALRCHTIWKRTGAL